MNIFRSCSTEIFSGKNKVLDYEIRKMMSNMRGKVQRRGISIKGKGYDAE